MGAILPTPVPPFLLAAYQLYKAPYFIVLVFCTLYNNFPEDQIINNLKKKYIVFLCGTTWESKHWSLESWQMLSQLIKEKNNSLIIIMTNNTKDYDFAKQLLIYNSTGNFDRVSTMIVAMYQRLAYRTLRKKASTVNNNGTTLLRSINLYGINK